MDQLSRLPVELRQNILSRLSGADLAGCSAVCKLWRSLVNDDYLWKNLVPESERNVPMESLSREIHKHKGQSIVRKERVLVGESLPPVSLLWILPGLVENNAG
ncbi:hypothetical protein AAG570_009246 [Ranatra chinensis]|uniref:F-box domain-containing protein n=1 Tax=Ranatra chinensis TaxID=642074 RepID=A0ABD0YTB0_9HEMI